MFNAVPFMKWCKTNNDNILAFYRSKDNLMQFYRFIVGHYKSPAFIKELDVAQSILKKYKSLVAEKDDRTLARTMRMTIIELM